MYFNPLSFACTKSRIESIGGIWLGMPGKSLSWLGSMVRTLSVSHSWPHGLSPSPLGETTLSRAGRAVGGRSRGASGGRGSAHHSQCCYAQEEMWLQSKYQWYQSLSWRYQMPSTSGLAGQGATGPATLHTFSNRSPWCPKRVLQAQNTWGSMHSFHPGSSPWTTSILSTLQPLWPYCSVFFD